MKRIALIVLTLLALTVPALAEGTLSAQGNGAVYAKPDQATINLGVSYLGSDVSKTQAKVNERLAAVREALLKLGVAQEEISISDIYIYASYNYDTDPAAITGYNVSHQIKVLVKDPAKAGEVIDAAMGAGANQLNGIEFDLADRSEAYAQALKNAVQNALAHARTMAEAGGIQLGQLRELTESGYGGDFARGYYAENDAGGMGSATVIDVGLVKIEASVTAVYQTE